MSGSNEWQDGTRNKHYQCALLQADGSLGLENNRNAGDSTDLFSESPGITVSHSTTPSSRMWNGTDSGLMISEVDASSQDISFTVGEPLDEPIVEIESFPSLLIPDDDPNGVTDYLMIDSSGNIINISVRVEIIHSWISDLKVSFVAPDGTEVTLHYHEGANGDDIRKIYDKETLPGMKIFEGSEIHGKWSLVVVDTASQDVGRLVRWGLVVRHQRHSMSVTETANPNIEIPDSDFQGISSEIQISQDGAVKNISVSVEIEHTYIGDLRVELISPSGQVVWLHNKTGGRTNNIKRLYDIGSTSALNDLVGDLIRGNWQLRVRDMATVDRGKLISWSSTIDY